MIETKLLLEIAGFFVGVISVCFTIHVGLKNGRKTDEVSFEERIKRETIMDVKLNEIGNDVKEIKETVKSIQDDIRDHEGRIVKLEASYKAEHKRLDEVFGAIMEVKDRKV